MLAKAQLSVGYTGLYGNYMKMGEVRRSLENKLSEVIKDIPNAAIVADFPDYLAHAVDLNYMMDKEEFGFQIMRMSTGGKIAYADYSGKYVNKLTLTGIRIGTRYRRNLKEFTFKEKQTLMFFGELSPGITLSTLKHKVYEEFKNETVEEKNDDKYSSTGISLLPQVGIKTNFGRLGIHMIVGYDFDLGGKVDNDEDSKISWSGFRAGIGVSYVLGKKKDKTEPEKE